MKPKNKTVVSIQNSVKVNSDNYFASFFNAFMENIILAFVESHFPKYDSLSLI
jgi:hypothetical protein